MDVKFFGYILHHNECFNSFRVFFIVILLYATNLWGDVIQDGDYHYALALNANTVYEQAEEFNRALKFYYQAKDAEAYIGNCYFQLSEYPWAILYYYRALQVLPRNNELKDRLTLAQKHLQLSEKSDRSVLDSIFVLNQFLSDREQWNGVGIFILSGLGCLLFGYKKFKWIICLIILGILLLLSHIFVKQYFTPLDAIVVRGLLYILMVPI